MSKVKVEDRRLAAIMFADISGYSRMMSLNEDLTLSMNDYFIKTSSNIVSSYEGKIIKKIGDAVFCEFNSSKNAVDASMEIQKSLSEYNHSQPKDFKLLIRIGIHIGDIVVEEDGDILGDGVNVASRITPFANPGGICISSSVQDALRGHPQYNIIEKGSHDLKNILKKYSIFDIQTGFESTPLSKANSIQAQEQIFPENYQLSFVGDAHYPSINPNGNFVAYSDYNNLFVQNIKDGNKMCLLKDARNIFIESWSPDGSELLVYLFFKNDNNNGLAIVSHLGRSVRYIPNSITPQPSIAVWSPNGNEIAYTCLTWKKIVIIDKATLAVKNTIKVDLKFNFLLGICWSPIDENIIYFSLLEHDNKASIYQININTLEIKLLYTTSENNPIYSLQVSKKTQSIYFVEARFPSDNNHLLKLSINDNENKLPDLIKNDFQARRLSITEDNLLVYADSFYNANLYKKSITDKNDSNNLGAKLTQGTSKIWYSTLSSDSKMVAFKCVAGEIANIHLITLDDNNSKQITHFNDAYCGEPSFSPDSKKIAYSYMKGDIKKIHIIDSMTGQFLKEYDLNNSSLSQSICWATPNSIYYMYHKHRNWGRLDLSNGTITDIFKDTEKGWRFSLMLSPDGKYLAFHGNYTDIKKGCHGTFVIPADNHELEENNILYSSERYYHVGWSYDNKWLYIASYKDKEEDEYKICRVSRKNWEIDKVLHKTKNSSAVGISKKEDFVILNVKETHESDIWLIKNFDPEFNN